MLGMLFAARNEYISQKLLHMKFFLFVTNYNKGGCSTNKMIIVSMYFAFLCTSIQNQEGKQTVVSHTTGFVLDQKRIHFILPFNGCLSGPAYPDESQLMTEP